MALFPLLLALLATPPEAPAPAQPIPANVQRCIDRGTMWVANPRFFERTRVTHADGRREEAVQIHDRHEGRVGHLLVYPATCRIDVLVLEAPGPDGRRAAYLAPSHMPPASRESLRKWAVVELDERRAHHAPWTTTRRRSALRSLAHSPKTRAPDGTDRASTDIWYDGPPRRWRSLWRPHPTGERWTVDGAGGFESIHRRAIRSERAPRTASRAVESWVVEVFRDRERPSRMALVRYDPVGDRHEVSHVIDDGREGRVFAHRSSTIIDIASPSSEDSDGGPGAIRYVFDSESGHLVRVVAPKADRLPSVERLHAVIGELPPP